MPRRSLKRFRFRHKTPWNSPETWRVIWAVMLLHPVISDLLVRRAITWKLRRYFFILEKFSIEIEFRKDGGLEFHNMSAISSISNYFVPFAWIWWNPSHAWIWWNPSHTWIWWNPWNNLWFKVTILKFKPFKHVLFFRLMNFSIDPSFFPFLHNFSIRPNAPRELRRDPSNCRFREHGMWYSSNTARIRTRNLFRHKSAPIPLDHSDACDHKPHNSYGMLQFETICRMLTKVMYLVFRSILTSHQFLGYSITSVRSKFWRLKWRNIWWSISDKLMWVDLRDFNL